MERKRFEALVLKAIESLPTEFQDKLENVDIIVNDLPSPQQSRRLRLRDPLQLLGLYEGIPQTVRTRGYNLVPPDKITIFQQSIEAICQSAGEIESEIRSVVQHEIAHHFGIDDGTLYRIEKQKRSKNKAPRSNG